MIKVILACSAGMSTSLLMNKIKQAAQERSIELDINAVSEANISEYLEGTNLILLGPQVKYLEKSINELVEHKIPVAVIALQKYGLMDGNAVLDDILAITGK